MELSSRETANKAACVCCSCQDTFQHLIILCHYFNVERKSEAWIFPGGLAHFGEVTAWGRCVGLKLTQTTLSGINLVQLSFRF